MQKIITVTDQSDQELKKKAVSFFQSSNSLLKKLYPDFDLWVAKKVIPGLDDGSRKIILSVTDEDISGIAVLKDDGLEKKLCCLRVAEPYQNRFGIGDKLFKKSFELLGTDKPLLSVSEDMLPAYRKLFAHYGFAIEGVHPEYYRPTKTEFSYNGEEISPSAKN